MLFYHLNANNKRNKKEKLSCNHVCFSVNIYYIDRKIWKPTDIILTVFYGMFTVPLKEIK